MNVYVTYITEKGHQELLVTGLSEEASLSEVKGALRLLKAATTGEEIKILKAEKVEVQ